MLPKWLLHNKILQRYLLSILADTLDKSINYSSGNHFNDNKLKNLDQKYILLCDTALKKCKTLSQGDVYTFISGRNDDISQKFDSAKLIGKNSPDPKGDLILSKSGVTVPAGNVVPISNWNNNCSSMQSWRMSHTPYNEYVVYDSKMVEVRYIVRFS